MVLLCGEAKEFFSKGPQSDQLELLTLSAGEEEGCVRWQQEEGEIKRSEVKCM